MTTADSSADHFDVVIIGAGPGGLAAAIVLRRAGLRALIVEPDPFPRDRLGESLDWSSPRLLRRLGVDPEDLIAAGVGTHKRGIVVQPADAHAWKAQPPDVFTRWPLKFEVMTLHVDRAGFDQRLFEVARDLGTTFIWDKVSVIEASDDRAIACVTSGGRRVTGRWFMDASGQARLFARRFDVPRMEYGDRKVCLWTYFNTPPVAIGTTFYGDTGAPEYVTWTWEIPITRERASVGCVMAADKLARERQLGKKPDEVLRDELLRYPRFHTLLAAQSHLDVRACSYRCYVHGRASGKNWFLIGEAASLPDPLTANGVTAAFRHAQEASALIVAAHDRGRLTAGERYPYDTNVRRMGHVFNHAIETGIYEWPVRCGVGSLAAQKIYTSFSYTINALYSRFQPHKRLGVELFGVLLKGVWLWFEGWALVGRLGMRLRGVTAAGRAHAVDARA